MDGEECQVWGIWRLAGLEDFGWEAETYFSQARLDAEGGVRDTSRFRCCL